MSSSFVVSTREFCNSWSECLLSRFFGIGVTFTSSNGTVTVSSMKIFTSSWFWKRASREEHVAWSPLMLLCCSRWRALFCCSKREFCNDKGKEYLLRKNKFLAVLMIGCFQCSGLAWWRLVATVRWQRNARHFGCGRQHHFPQENGFDNSAAFVCNRLSIVTVWCKMHALEETAAAMPLWCAKVAWKMARQKWMAARTIARCWGYEEKIFSSLSTRREPHNEMLGTASVLL